MSKLNHLQRQLPEGLLVSAAWLTAHGYSAQLCSKYVAHGWLERLTPGVYRRPASPLVWQQAAISLQTLLKFPLVVGGETALALQGFEHYLSAEEKDIQLTGLQPPPTWLEKLRLPVRFRYQNTGALFRNEPPSPTVTDLAWLQNKNAALSSDARGDFDTIPWGQWNWPLTLSGPERAILEFLNGLPQHKSFEQADKLMEGLTTLRPRRLQKLLADCKSIKVKRLFLFFAERHQHAWFKHLDKGALDLGTGKRMLVRGGKLDHHYLITVPEEFHGNQ